MAEQTVDWMSAMAGLSWRELQWLLPYAAGALRVALILLIAWAASRILKRLIRKGGERIKRHKRDPEELKRVDTLVRIGRSLVSILVWLVAGTIALSALGFSIAPILATAGVSGIAVGFAAQSLVKDYFAGFIMLLEGQIRVGDVVEVGGAAGVVEAMTLRYVRLRNFAGEVIFVPNGTIVNVINKSLNFAYAVVDAGVAYREDVDEALAVMRETAAELAADPEFGPRILEPAEIVGVEQWADSAVILRLRMKVAPAEQWAVRREYLRRLKHAFDARGIEIPFPHLTLYPGQAKDGSAPPLWLKWADEQKSASLPRGERAS
ncbi:MAG: hypothetical protein KatS3mg124_1340 [Porticoccaceae bacterium]|nr:MAG: hypothetical protein KatS3mg124_1340 [Porticoccaceae bacterium]